MFSLLTRIYRQMGFIEFVQHLKGFWFLRKNEAKKKKLRENRQKISSSRVCRCVVDSNQYIYHHFVSQSLVEYMLNNNNEVNVLLLCWQKTPFTIPSLNCRWKLSLKNNRFLSSFKWLIHKSLLMLWTLSSFVSFLSNSDLNKLKKELIYNWKLYYFLITF